jgi:small subunit ribosomal protein S5
MPRPSSSGGGGRSGGPGGGPAGGGQGGGRDRRDRRDFQPMEQESEFAEEVININRVAKVVKGGRKFHFTALVAVGDRKTRVGLGYGKAGELVDAIKKAVDEAKRNLIVVYKRGTTLPYEIKRHYCASTILLRPAAKGHGIIAGGAARPILALSGLEDVTAKFVGSNNPLNCARATFMALKLMATPDYINRLRSGEKLDPTGHFIADKRRAAAEEALAAIAASEPDLPVDGPAFNTERYEEVAEEE